MAFQTPAWLSSAVFYEVFVRNHGPRGGFEAVTADLPRIRALGVDVVWLMPIFPIGTTNRLGTCGSPYAIADYNGIDPALGDEAALVRLIEACHRLGMKIILDIVFNHTSPDSVLAREHPEWFLTDPAGRPTAKFPEWTDIADLRYLDDRGRPRTELWDRQVECLARWADRGFDGFRCDVASVVPPAFWARAKAELARRTGRELIWLAETVHKSFLKLLRDRGFRVWSDGEMLEVFDLSYDHDGATALDDYFAGRGALSRYLDHLYVQETMNPAGSLKLRFVENHDLPRAADKLRGADRLRAWTAFQALLPGAFLVYAGQEGAQTVRPGLFDPSPVPLPAADDPFAQWLTDLLALVRQVKTECRFFTVDQPAAGLVVLKWDDRPEQSSTRYTAVLNLEDRFGTLGRDWNLEGTNLFDGTEVSLVPGAAIPRSPVLVRTRS